MLGEQSVLNCPLSGVALIPSSAGKLVAYPYKNSITGVIEKAWLAWPPGVEFLKKLFGQRRTR